MLNSQGSGYMEPYTLPPASGTLPLKLFVSLYLVSCRQHMIGSWCFYSNNLCLSIGMFTPLTFNVIFNMAVFVFTILIHVFYPSLSSCFLFPPFLPPFWIEFLLLFHFTFSVGLEREHFICHFLDNIQTWLAFSCILYQGIVFKFWNCLLIVKMLKTPLVYFWVTFSASHPVSLGLYYSYSHIVLDIYRMMLICFYFTVSFSWWLSD